MRLLDYLMGVLSLLALPLVAWWGVNQSPQSATRLEAQLQAQAQQALQLADMGWAAVEMEGQTAILTGPAPSEDAVPEAAAVVLRSSGAGGLVFGGVSQVATRTHPAAEVWPFVWSAETLPEGGLVLSGHVASRAAKAELYKEAAAIANGRVQDNTVVANGAPDGNWLGIARFALLQLSEMDAGRADLAGHRLMLQGNVADEAVRLRLTEATRAVAAPFSGTSLLRGTPAWSATRQTDALVLSGQVPTEAERRTLMRQAKLVFSGEVRDEMSTGLGVPPAGWVDGAATGLGHLAAFRTGTLTFDPAVNGFAFEGEAPASTLEFLEEDMTRAAGAWPFVIAAAPVAPPAAEPGASKKECVSAINQLLSGPAIAFRPGRAEFDRASAAGLDALAGTAQGCSEMQIRVDGDALTEARASALAGFLERAGARRPRIAAIGYGPDAGERGRDGVAAAPSARVLEFIQLEQTGQ